MIKPQKLLYIYFLQISLINQEIHKDLYYNSVFACNYEQPHILIKITPVAVYSRVQKDELERRQKNPTYKTFIKKAIRMKKCDYLMVCVSLLIKILYFYLIFLYVRRLLKNVTMPENEIQPCT